MSIDLTAFPRVRLCHTPTPLESMARLSEFLGGPAIFIKRDDCTGLATGGNKTRKLEFLMSDAQRAGADTILTQGAVQSNHVRQTAAAAAKLGFRCRVLLEERLPGPPEQYETSGNVFLDRLFGAELTRRPSGTDMDRALAEAAEAVERQGGRPYVIPGGGSNRIGALGYVSCLDEMLRQARDQGIRIDHIVHATGSAGTQAGLVAGMRAAGADIPIHGISVRFDKATQEEKVYGLAAETADFIGAGAVARDRVVAYDGYVGPGYGQPTDDMVHAVRETARREGILLDPVYSGKGMAGLIDLARKGRFSSRENVIFIHTGGAVSLFAYQWAFG